MRTYLSNICTLLVAGLAATGGCYNGSSGGQTGDSAATEAGGTPADTGQQPTGSDSGDTDQPTGEPADGEPLVYSGLRRLTADEYNLTVRDLLGLDAASQALLPNDPLSPFDNDYRDQTASQALIDSADLLAADLATEALVDPVARTTLVGCTPAGPDDAVCFDQFIAGFGRRALRRTLEPADIERFAVFLDHSIEAGDFYVGVESALRAFLQHPEFLYRVEIGEPVADDPGVYRLGSREIAARLSYFLWGSTPPDWLLDQAEGAGLDTPEKIRAAAQELLADPRARARIARFHALWMGYNNLPHGAELADAMKAETQALIDRVLFDKRGPWQDLLRSDQTFVSDLLAGHYGLPLPGGDGPSWVDYGDSGRRGLLSHGSFLSVGAKFTDTSPTQRGLLIRTRLFCQDIELPDDIDVDVDNPPGDPNACKPQRYSEHASGACANCHSLMDPIGFGLENYDMAGRFREFEPDRPDCPISGEGELLGVGKFSGPAELGELMLGVPDLNHCVLTQLYRFAMGRYELHEQDRLAVQRLVQGVPVGGDLPFEATLLDFIDTPAFRHRREEPEDI